MWEGENRRQQKRGSLLQQFSAFLFLILGVSSFVVGILGSALLYIIGVLLLGADLILVSRYNYFWILDKIRKNIVLLVICVALLGFALWSVNTGSKVTPKIALNSALGIVVIWFIVRTALPFGKE